MLFHIFSRGKANVNKLSGNSTKLYIMCLILYVRAAEGWRLSKRPLVVSSYSTVAF